MPIKNVKTKKRQQRKKRGGVIDLASMYSKLDTDFLSSYEAKHEDVNKFVPKISFEAGLLSYIAYQGTDVGIETSEIRHIALDTAGEDAFLYNMIWSKLTGTFETLGKTVSDMGCVLLTSYKRPESTKHACDYMIVKQRADKQSRIYVVFRGTSGLPDVLTDANIMPTTLSYLDEIPPDDHCKSHTTREECLADTEHHCAFKDRWLFKDNCYDSRHFKPGFFHGVTKQRTYQTPDEEVKVSSGFLTLYNSLRNHFLSDLWEVAKEHGAGSHLIFAGHSMGASLSALACLDVSLILNSMGNTLQHFPKVHGVAMTSTLNMWRTGMQFYSFASPSFGNVKFAELFEKHIPQSWRFVNKNDIVPRVKNLIDTHVGTMILIGTSHTGLQISQDVIQFNFNTQDHLMYSYLKGLEAMDFDMILYNYKSNPVSVKDLFVEEGGRRVRLSEVSEKAVY